jgi:fatty-acyl-CoA synthase
METPLTFAAALARHVAERPNDIAFFDGTRAISFAAFDRLCLKSAAWLRTQGIGKGDRVAVWLVNRVEWMALWFGLARVGAALVAVNTRYRASELEYILQRSGARMLVLELNFRKIDFPAVLKDVNPDMVPALQCVAVFEGGADRPAMILAKPTVSFDLQQQDDAVVPDDSEPDALVALFTTSGTTRGPKLVMHTQRTMMLHSQRVAHAYDFEAEGVHLLGALPFCGVFGLNAVMAAFSCGAPTTLMDAFDGAIAARLMEQSGLTHAFGSDEMYSRIFENALSERPFPAARRLGFGSFNYGAEEFALPLRDRGLPLTGLYGSSEVQALFAMQPLTLPVAQQIQGGGRPASGARAEVRIRDIETGELLGPGISGEIEIRADTNFVGYFNDAEATAKAMDTDGFFHTGDVGWLREDGTFVYQTRLGDAIRLAGFLVSPVEIEEVLTQFPSVAMAQVVAVEIGGQMRCVAFVTPRPGTVPDEADVIARASASMGAFKVPARVWVVDEFPTTLSSNGVKIQRAKLRTMALERLFGDATSITD